MPSIRPLKSALLDKAKNELNEDPEKIEENLHRLREWVEHHPNIKARTDSQFLLAFLRAEKWNVEAAKKKIEAYYRVRKAVPELFSNRNVEDPKVREAFKLGVGLIFPKTHGESGPCISIVRTGCYDPSQYHIKDLMKVGTMIADIQLLEQDNMVISGLLEIMDMSNVGLRHLLQMDASFMRKLATVAEGATPLRHKGLHFINTPPGFDTIFNIFKACLGESSQTRIYTHGHNMESLYAHVPKHLLPAEYGGENSSIPEVIEYWTKKVHAYRDYFAEDEKYGIVEEYDSNKPIKESRFGISGTFRGLGEVCKRLRKYGDIMAIKDVKSNEQIKEN